MVSSDHTYPHSLLGLHALPTSLVSHGTEELRSLDVPAESHSANGNDTTLTEPVNVFVAASDSSGEILDTGNNSDHTLPSLGYLDEALRFIAAERARWSALRVASASNTHVNAPADDGDNMDDGSGEELEAGEGEGDLEWKRLDDGQEPEQPKKRRRRKRPPKTHAIPVASEVFKADISSMTTSKGPSLDAQSNVNTITPSASPKKKKRSKSIPASVHSSSQSLLTGSPASGKGKNKKQVQEKMFLVPPPATQAITILRRPVQDSGQIKERAHTSEEDVQIDVALDSDIDGAKTPTNLSSTYSGSLASKVSSESSPINLMGKKGKRVGRKEREREKMKRDLETGKARESNVGEKPKAPADDFGIEYTDDGDNIDEGFETRDDGDNDDEDHGENDSISNMALLQPPRRKRNRSLRRKAADTAYIHSVIGIGELPAAYKSTPATPKKILYDGEELADEDEFKPISGALVTEVKVDVDHADDVFISKPGPEDGVPVEGGGEKKRRFRAKRVKALTHASSEPELRAEASVVEEASTTGTSSAAHENIGTSKSKKGKKKMPLGVEKDSLDMDRNKIQKPISVSGVRLSANQKHNKTDISESVVFPSTSKRGRIIALATKLKQLFPEQQEELARIVARLERQGAAPPQARNGRAMIWDSAGVALSSRTAPIAIPGMTKKRFRKGHARTTSEGTGAGTGAEGLDYDSTEGGFGGGVGVRLKAHFPEIGEEDGDEEEEIDPRGRPPRKNDALIHVFIDHSNILIGFLSHVKRHPPQRKFVDIGRGRPLPAVLTTATTFNPNPADSTASAKGSHTRPLPIQSNSDAKRRNYPIPLPSFATASRSLPAHSTLSSYTSDGQDKCGNSAEHETGVVANDVAGSDTLFVGSLHRTKEKKVLKHLWHAALTLILERGRPITRRVVVTSSPLYQPMDAIERLGYELGVFIRVPDFGDGMDRERHNRSNGRPNGGVNKNGSSPVTAGTLSGSPKKVSTAGHARHASGNISTESSGDGSGNGASAPNIRIKYREQGVDELLQLKLHQALAATDYVPEGSTIVLATGDGNVGQFNEDGFLGPVRTALKRGWRVELYAWEDGLSRSWRREFGSGSEWGRRGMFRIIGMEQFASSLLTTFE